MFDQAYCAGMTLGTPQISLEGLTELAAVLALLGETHGRRTRSQLSKKEGARAKKSIPQSGAICSRTGAADTAASDHRQPGRLLGALADLLLAALGAETMATREDDDERQDHV
ncbi:MAG TPA: hypothetical protein VKB76_01520 [Ktedonobacterales bacterium]|nr:hypothetical protein [Ktedonobacterales bacterium]